MPEPYRTILLFGPPGVGKGTQGKLLGAIPGMFHLATGDIFRSLDKDSKLGRQFLHYSSRGELVPDDLTIQVWRDYVQKRIDTGDYNPESDLLILDGIPRSVYQAEAVNAYIDVLGIVSLCCPNFDEAVARMKRRAQRENRHDDADEKVIRRRFEVYENETAPVLSVYDEALTTQIDAVGTPAEVLHRVLSAVAPIYARHFGNPLE